MYFCPMHPEYSSDKPGICPKCGMKLELKGTTHSRSHTEETLWKKYLPLIVVITLISLTALFISFTEYINGYFSFASLITYFMTGFFLVFSGFKLIDLPGFANGYSTYDLFAKKWFLYGYIYPFIELFFAFSMILHLFPTLILWLEVIIMTFSGIGVALKLVRHEKFQCACLGTFLKVPLTKVTLIEDFGMALLAFILLILR